MAGRPTKYTPERVERILDALREGNTRQTACAVGGISDETFARWQRQFVQFVDAIKVAEAFAESRHVANIVRAADEGIWTASAWWLERRRHQQWGRQDKVDVTIKTDSKVMAAEFDLPLEIVEAEYKRILAERS